MLILNRVNLDKLKFRMAGYWKLNATLFGVRNFQDHLILMLHQELYEAGVYTETLHLEWDKADTTKTGTVR